MMIWNMCRGQRMCIFQIYMDKRGSSICVFVSICTFLHCNHWLICLNWAFCFCMPTAINYTQSSPCRAVWWSFSPEDVVKSLLFPQHYHTLYLQVNFYVFRSLSLGCIDRDICAAGNWPELPKKKWNNLKLITFRPSYNYLEHCNVDYATDCTYGLGGGGGYRGWKPRPTDTIGVAELRWWRGIIMCHPWDQVSTAVLGLTVMAWHWNLSTATRGKRGMVKIDLMRHSWKGE